MRQFGQVITKEEAALADSTGRQPFNPPTEIVAVPSAEEMATWMPDPAPERRRYRTEINVSTGETKYVELTLEEYRARHVAKIQSRNEWLTAQGEAARKAKRQALLEKLLDEAEAKEGR
jgi:hypothetical protein